MQRTTETVHLISKDLLSLIPKFDGDQNILNLFIKKSEYILRNFNGPNSPVQTAYVFHCITSRLCGRAAALLSERDDISTWEQLKSVFIQHFGDPRSEECVAIELENLKIKVGETFSQFCNRIQQTRSTLFSKLNLLSDEGVKAAKMIIYNNMSLNVFLYNLPEDLIRIVRLKNCSNLENALSVVMEEVNFQYQYNAKNKNKPNTKPAQQPYTPNFINNFNSVKPQPSFVPNTFNSGISVGQNFKYGIPHQTQNNLRPGNNNFKFGIPNQGVQFRPGVSHSPVQQGFRPNLGGAPNNFKFGIPPQQGYRPQLNNTQFRPNFNVPNQRFKFGIPPQNQPQRNPPQLQDSDVSMRTVRPIRQNMITHNFDDSNLFYSPEFSDPQIPQYYDYQPDYVDYENIYVTDDNGQHDYENCYENAEHNIDATGSQDESVNFPLEASKSNTPK